MRRLIVTILVFLFSFQVNAECAADLRILPMHHAATVSEFQEMSGVATSEQRSTSSYDASSSGQAPHADFSDSVMSDAPLAHYRGYRGAWRSAIGIAFPTVSHPLFKPPPIV